MTPEKELIALIEKPVSVADLRKYSVPELDKLIDQLESGMTDILAQGDTEKGKKLNELLGALIDIRNEVKNTPMTPEQELIALIEKQLEDPCTTNLPTLCEFVKTAEGKETATRMILEYCTNNGVSVQTAMAHIDTEL